MIRTMICATLAAAVIAPVLAAPAFAEPQQATFSITFKWDRNASTEANYNAFRRLAQRECESPGRRPLALLAQERACTANILDRFVVQMGRNDVAALHTARTGRSPVAQIDFASRG